MQRKRLALAFGAAMTLVAIAACSGGSGPSAQLPATSAAAGATATTQSGTTLSFTINRKTPSRTHAHASASSRRSPKYIDPQNAEGMQIAVSGSGAATKTIYADITTTSPLCTYSSGSGIETCVLSLPSVAVSETIVGQEVDQPPASEVTTGPGAGYGTGFPTTANVIAAASTTATISGTSNAVTLAFGPVIDAQYLEALGPNGAYEEAGTDYSQQPLRILVTGGVAATDILYDCMNTFDNYFVENNPNSTAPFADVNGSPEPISLTAPTSASQILFAPIPYTSASPLPALSSYTYATTASLPNESDLWYNCELIFGMQVPASLTTPVTITASSNLSATTPITAGYVVPTPMAYTVVPLLVSAVTGTAAVTGATTASVTGTDYQGTAGFGPYGSDTNQNHQYAGECMDTTTPTTEDASVASAGAINTTTWTQTFTITPVAAGTCSFVLVDLAATTYYNYIATKPVTLTILP